MKSIKIIILGLFIFSANFTPEILSAQEENGKSEEKSIEITIEESDELSDEEAKTLRKNTQKLIKEKAQQMKAEIDEVRQRQKDGEITLEEMGEEIDAIARAYSKEIESEAEKLGNAIRKEVDESLSMYLDTIPGEDDDETRIRIKVRDKKKSPKRTRANLILAVGWHTMLSSDAAAQPAINFWSGGFTEVGFLVNTRIGGARSPIHLNYGVSLLYNKADIGGGNFFLQTDDDGIPAFVDRNLDIRDNKLRTSLVTGTMGLKYAPKRKGWHVEANGFAGVLFRAKQNIEFVQGNEIIVEDRRARSGFYGISNFNYGVSAAFGYKQLSLYARYDISPVWDRINLPDGLATNAFNAFSVGFRFNFI